MEQRHLILIDEQPQGERLKRIANNLRKEGIQLIYKEINPTTYFIRQENGDINCDKTLLKLELQNIPFLEHLDVFATDYNLIKDELKGIDLIKMLYDILPNYRNKVVMYSAQIDKVINSIITERATNFEQQVSMLKLLAMNEIDYLNSEKQFEYEFQRLIQTEPNKTIDDRLAESLHILKNVNFRCSIPGYTDKSINELGELLVSKTNDTIQLKKDITDYIISCITSIKDYE